MIVKCPCGDWHDMSPTMLAMVLEAFQEGDLQIVGTRGVKAECYQNAFTEERKLQFHQRYPGNITVK